MALPPAKNVESTAAVSTEPALASAGEHSPSTGEFECGNCKGAFRSPQGLAGHRRLAHSASTSKHLEERTQDLDERGRAVAARERSAQQHQSEATRIADTYRGKEADVLRREQALRAAESVPERARLQAAVRRETAALPEVTSETILRVGGDDFRIQDGRLNHLYWPSGEKTEFAEGQRFQLEGRAYVIRRGRLETVRSSTILAELLGEET